MRLDNRSTRLVVSDLPEGKDPQRVKEWLKSFGDVSSFEDGGGEGEDGASRPAFSVTFQSRQSGEQAIRSGLDVPDVGKIKLAWAPAAASQAQVAGVGSGSGTASPAPGQEQAEGQDGGAEEEEGHEDDGDNWKR